MIQKLMRQPTRSLAYVVVGALVAFASPPATAATDATRAQAEVGVQAELSSPEERLRQNKVNASADIRDAVFQADQTQGLQGDGAAALRVAEMYRTGANGAPKDERLMVQWLLHASSLNNGAASYQLYRHFVEQKLDRDAVFFENRALEQGFIPPARIDPRRG